MDPQIVRDLVARKFGVIYTLQGVGKLLARLGLSPQRPLVRAYEQNPERVRRWKREQFPAIREEAARLGAAVFFADEAAIRTDHRCGTTSGGGRGPYSPELNPDEWIWKNVKHGHVRNVATPNPDELRKGVAKTVSQLVTYPEIVRTFFADPHLPTSVRDDSADLGAQ